MSTEHANETPEFSITRVLPAPREAVWRAWTDETELADWLYPFGVRTESISFDVREGGRYAYTMVNDETGERFPTGGVYLEVTRHERLVFTWGVPDAPIDSAPVITLTFSDTGEGTELVLHLRGYAGRPGDGFVYDGWDEALTNLGKHLGRAHEG